MNYEIGKIPFPQLFLYVAFGIVLLIIFTIINNYIIPTLKNQQHIINKYWQKIQIISWLIFFGLFFIALFRANMILTVVFTIIVLGLGWNFWRNIFSGIVIKFNNQFKKGETISSDFATGVLQSIHLAQSELVNSKGEVVIIPNYKLRTSVLKRLYKKNNIQTHRFQIKTHNKTATESIYQKALYCPFLSANQKIQVERINEQEFILKAFVIDTIFVDEVNAYFALQ
ncbi:MAG TPA: mechanosensitive ion channel family protein [Phaeodactylibacter sp.]|nr:mechanosensitive ion channel family protein [Phaeodactylibacter sp.]